ncbi:hypothetical protein MNEG_13670 [Monoraphidium neglectum]|uniref:Centrosomal protein of 70 kDa n=1 Tax=Monoraphidium neglectum TaxID=145388 RepID=A0A0D2KEM8_9CHLO|nr:hypothetical protein MNEG_13670 [Monoraphidium neglectum]KIY94293.1 hypothetical protein MNEG_13670 [Monoraphidium neglectum]|eukprot:XP_013893313.1 hypothetical protein MNEG_13670 [Monoraphidium neglectum]
MHVHMRVLAGARGARAQMERDKAVARLGLGLVAEMPRELLVDAVQGACIALELPDPAQLSSKLRRVVSVLSAVPQLEAFVAEVCGLVFRSGVAFCPKELTRAPGGVNPGAAPRALAAWLRGLRQGDEMRALLLRLRGALAARSGGGGGAVTGASAAGANGDGSQTDWEAGAAEVLAGGRQLVAEVEELVSAEASAMAAHEVLAAAEGLMADRPEGLLQKLLGHAQKLLDCPDLEGVIPALNRLYVSHSELSNLFRSLSSLLALPADAGPAAAVGAIRQLVAAAGRYQRLAAQLFEVLRVSSLEEVLPALTQRLAPGAAPGRPRGLEGAAAPPAR